MKPLLRCAIALWMVMAGSAAAEPLSINATEFCQIPPDSERDDFCCLTAAGRWMTVLEVSTNGPYTFVVVGRGDRAAGEWPQMDVRIDDEKTGTFSVHSTNWASYTFTRALRLGRHEVALGFANEQPGTNATRALYLESLTIIPSNEDETVSALSPSAYRKEQKAARADLLKKNDDQIERIRKGDLTVTVLDPAGKPLPDARISIEQTRQEFLFGTALCAEMFDPKTTNTDAATYRETVRKYFNHAVTEGALDWPAMEPMRDVVLYDAVDRMADWCKANGISLRGHCLFSGCNLPDWAKPLPDDDLRSVIARRARNVAGHYQGLIDEFDVNNEMLHCTYLSERLGESITRQMFAEAEGANPHATLYVNDYGVLEGKDLLRYADKIRDLRDLGVSVGGIGLQAHCTGPVDVLQIQKSLDLLGQFGLPIKITEFDCVNEDERVQAQVLEDVYRVAYAHPAVEGILAWGFWESCMTKPSAALLRADFSKKPSAERYEKLVLGDWRTRVEGKTDADGRLTCRAFYGAYAIRATLPGGSVLATNAVLAKGIGRTAVTFNQPPRAPEPAAPAKPAPPPSATAEKKPEPPPAPKTSDREESSPAASDDEKPVDW